MLLSLVSVFWAMFPVAMGYRASVGHFINTSRLQILISCNVMAKLFPFLLLVAYNNPLLVSHAITVSNSR
jgi:hypothetical protein